MKKRAVILSLLFITGCNQPAEVTADKPSACLYDLAIENLSITTEQLESIRREKDFFIKVLEDFERQRVEYGQFMDSRRIRRQMEYFADWHRDILQRERALEVRHALSVLVAHDQDAKRKNTDPNQTTIVGLSPAKP